MRNEIHIGKPYITEKDNCVQLCADITRPAGEFTYWFEFPKEYEQYLCTERSNAFVLAVLEYAMVADCDIKCETPLDEALHYQLTNYGSKIISDNISFKHNIKIDVPYTTERIESAGAVGTGCSAGVDSFYAILRHLDPPEKAFKLTHLVIANNGAFALYGSDKSETHFFTQAEKLKAAAKALGGIPLIVVNTNADEFTSDIEKGKRNANSPIKLASIVYALQKLFSIYYIASSFTLDMFDFRAESYSALLYYSKLVSSPTISFYSSGTEAKRIEKNRLHM